MIIVEVKLVSYFFIGFGKIFIVDRVLGWVKIESYGVRYCIFLRILKIYYSMVKCGYCVWYVIVFIILICNMNGISDKEY